MFLFYLGNYLGCLSLWKNKMLVDMQPHFGIVKTWPRMGEGQTTPIFSDS